MVDLRVTISKWVTAAKRNICQRKKIMMFCALFHPMPEGACSCRLRQYGNIVCACRPTRFTEDAERDSWAKTLAVVLEMRK
jgi:hypothetical protein